MNLEEEQFFEQSLSQAFQPVAPSSQFVSRLRERIVVRHPQVLIEHMDHRRQSLVMALGGVLFVGLSLLTLGRVMYYLLGLSKRG